MTNQLRHEPSGNIQSTVRWNRSRFGASVFVLTGVLLLATACGGEGEAVSPSSSASTTSETSIAPTAVPTTQEAKAETSSLAGTVINGLPTKKELAKSSKGVYIQTTIAEDDPALTYNQAIVNENAFRYTPEEITAFQKKVVTFIAEETIDSTLNDMPSMQDRFDWFEKNKGIIDPGHQSELQAILNSEDNTHIMVFISDFRDKYKLKYGENVSHVISRTITPTSISGGDLEGKEAIRLDANVEFVLHAQVGDQTGHETTTGVVGYTFLRDSPSSEWLMSGFNTTFSSNPLM